MKPTRDIERTLDRWFAPGPERVPEGVVERALANIDHIPQRRGNALRRFKMPTNLRLLAVAAVLAAGGAAYLLVGSDRPSETAEPIPVLSLGGSAGTWSAQRPSVFGHPAGTYEFDSYSPLVGRAPDGTRIEIGRAETNAGMATIAVTPGCSGEGTYLYQHSADYLRLVVAVVKDACTDRRKFLEGEWLRLRAEPDLQSGRAYTIDMGVGVEFVVPDWPTIDAPGPWAFAEGSPGTAPRVLIVGTDIPHTHKMDYAFELVVDPRPAVDVCDIAKGSLDSDWTLDGFAARPAPSVATFSPPTRTTVSGFPAVMIDVTGSPGCYNDQFIEDQCCPDDLLGPGVGGRLWAVDLGSRKVLIRFTGNGHGVTPEEMKIGQELVRSLRLTPPGD
jgi:hypothetical protein